MKTQVCILMFSSIAIDAPYCNDENDVICWLFEHVIEGEKIFNAKTQNSNMSQHSNHSFNMLGHGLRSQENDQKVKRGVLIFEKTQSKKSSNWIK